MFTGQQQRREGQEDTRPPEDWGEDSLTPCAAHSPPSVSPGREPARLWWEERHVAVCHKALWTSDTPKPPGSVARERWGQARCGELLGFQFKASEGVEKSRLSWVCLPADQE